MRSLRQRLIILTVVGLFSLMLFRCVGPAPVEDYTLAYTALNAARAASAPRFANGQFNQAEDYYKQAVAEYEDRKYADAKENFRRARKFAEMAENSSVIKKARTGETE